MTRILKLTAGVTGAVMQWFCKHPEKQGWIYRRTKTHIYIGCGACGKVRKFERVHIGEHVTCWLQ